jgi:hypothetical protein
MIKDLYSLYYNGTTIDDETKDFIKTWHYSKSSRSQQQKHVFKLVDQSNRLVGVAIYGNPMSRHYNSSETIELRRLCLIDDTPKNTESYFIAKTLKWLEKNTSYTSVVSFADPNHGHSGTIYKASNFHYDGLEKGGNPRVLKFRGREIHMRQVYQKKNGQYTDDAVEWQDLIKSGDATVEKQERKHRYTYDLRR